MDSHCRLTWTLTSWSGNLAEKPFHVSILIIKPFQTPLGNFSVLKVLNCFISNKFTTNYVFFFVFQVWIIREWCQQKSSENCLLWFATERLADICRDSSTLPQPLVSAICGRVFIFVNTSFFIFIFLTLNFFFLIAFVARVQLGFRIDWESEDLIWSIRH